VVRLIVNGAECTVERPSGPTLLDVLRDDLGLTGTKCGCGEGECGACTVLVGGVPTRACTQDVASVTDAVTTVEGLAADRSLHPVQAAFVRARALQCGYCTPGMVISAVALLARDPAPDDATIRAALAGNICRCGGYPRILEAVHLAATGDLTAELAPADLLAPDPADRSVWTVLLPASEGSAGRDWGWSTPGGARLSIDSGGRITAYTGKVDAGQGNRAALTRLVAAELAVPTSAVGLEMGDTASAPLDLGTVGSRSTPDAGRVLRLVAATARRELVRAAGEQWSVDPADLTLSEGSVRDPASGREVAYGALVAGGPRTVHADPRESLQATPTGLTGVDDTMLHRYLTAAVTGAKRFPSDVTVPGMAHARVLRPPAYGADLQALDTGAAHGIEGVTVVEDGDLIGVVAPTPAAAGTALQAVKAQWTVDDQPADVDLEKHLRSHPLDGQGWGSAVHREVGDVDAAFAQAEIGLSATYHTAYLAHVPLEPRVAVATVNQDAATVWVGTQRPFAVQAEVAAVLELPPERVRIVVPDFGGGFGGKHSADVAVQAARLAKAAGRPVRVAWTRAEEFHWAYFRPAAVIDVRSAARRDGTLTGWEFTNINSGSAALFTPYQVANRRERFQPADSPLPQGSYRALAATANHFARESHLDELAAALGADPVRLRLRLLDDVRLTDVLAALAEHVGWPGEATGAGQGIGIACGLEKEARVATMAEVRVDPDGWLHVVRLVTAIDCGAVVDPSGLRNQVVGATVMGLGGALFEGIRFEGGQIRNGSMAAYRVPRFTDVPPIDVVVFDRSELPSAGAGETPIVAVAPAIANAIWAATGRRLRTLPLAPDGLVR
jgi:isoquinoline 1-oxidoreductase